MADSPNRGSGSEETRKFISNALTRFRLASEAESQTRKHSLDDVNFSIGKQWPEDIMAQRNLDGRPCLTMNHIHQFLKMVANEYRQQRPSTVVNPVGNGSDVDTAEIFQGAIRHIEVNSDAEVADDHAFDGMLRGGIGYTRVVTEYANEETTEQELKIKRIKNPFTVYFDPAAVEPDYSDALWCFIVEDMPIDDYKQTYGASRAASFEELSSIGDQAPGWATKETIRVAEYFHVTTSSKKYFYLEDGTRVEILPQGVQAVQSRDITDRKVKWCKINAIEILEESDWLGKYIPVIPVIGEDIDVDGKRYLAGLVRNMKDAQRMYNYWNSAATEMIALAPKSPFIMAEGQDENHEKEWAMANVRNYSSLKYKPISLNGASLPPPQREQAEPPIQAIAVMIRQADNDLKAAAGIYDASLGQRGPEQSGKALEQRKNQGDLATLNYSDNAARSLRHRGRVLLDLIPKVYDTARLQRIINPDGTVKHVGIYNSKDPQAQPPQIAGPDGKAIKEVYNIGVGSYDVVVSVGPSFQTQRKEAASTQIELMKALPQQAPFFADIAVRNMDIPQSRELADRLKKMLPPQLQEEAGDDPEAQIQKLQQQVMQLSQQHEALTQHLNAANQEIETKQVETQGKIAVEQLKADSARSIKEMELKKDILIAEIDAKTQETNLRMEWEREMWKELHGSAHDVGLKAMEQDHDHQMADKQQLAAQQQQEAQQGHEAEMAQQQQEAAPAEA